MINPDTNETIANITNTVLEHFGAAPIKPSIPALLKQMEGAKKVITVVADGLGYNFLDGNTKDDPRFAQLKQNDQLRKISTVFPSSTAPALMAIDSGMQPIEHGLLEWNMYFSELDDVINPLPYKSLTSDKPLPQIPEMIFSGTTVYQRLNTRSVTSYFILPIEYKDSLFTRRCAQGAKVLGYADGEDLVGQLKTAIEATDSEAYFYVYWPSVDSTEHAYGPSSNEAKKALSDFLDMLFNKFVDTLRGQAASDCFLILTADHGQVDVDPNKVRYLNDYPYVTESFQKSEKGKSILPAGNGRDAFLHLQDDKIDYVIGRLRQDLGDVADIYELTDKVVAGLFGTFSPHPEFFLRLGNVIILPKKNYKVWYKFAYGQESEVLGDHGGLSDDEIYVPLLSARVTDLK